MKSTQANKKSFLFDGVSFLVVSLSVNIHILIVVQFRTFSLAVAVPAFPRFPFAAFFTVILPKPIRNLSGTTTVAAFCGTTTVVACLYIFVDFDSVEYWWQCAGEC